ncbi:hypothetical protein [Actinoplanes sp. NPDC049118]|uniref:hypothetical protein n=1 Tax=Actinoplanes sp. NPDC049118 TaxID=3155769 RepID=UPI0033E41BD0
MSALTARPPTPPHPVWRFSVIVVLALAAGDAASGIAAAAVGGTGRPSGAGITGALLLAVALAGQAAAHHAVRTGRHRPLRLCLTVLVAWHAACTTALFLACATSGRVHDVEPVVFSAVLAAAGCWTARSAARQVGRGHRCPPQHRPSAP